MPREQGMRQSDGDVRITLTCADKGRHVLIVEDIDKETHFRPLSNFYKPVIPSLTICTLLDKYERREVDVNIPTGFKISGFVFGYGLDVDSIIAIYPSRHVVEV